MVWALGGGSSGVCGRAVCGGLRGPLGEGGWGKPQGGWFWGSGVSLWILGMDDSSGGWGAPGVPVHEDEGISLVLGEEELGNPPKVLVLGVSLGCLFRVSPFDPWEGGDRGTRG